MLQVGKPLPLDHAFYQRLLQGHCPAWERSDPPCGLQPTGPLLAGGCYSLQPDVLLVASLAGEMVEEAAAAGGLGPL